MFCLILYVCLFGHLYYYRIAIRSIPGEHFPDKLYCKHRQLCAIPDKLLFDILFFLLLYGFPPCCCFTTFEIQGHCFVLLWQWPLAFRKPLLQRSKPMSIRLWWQNQVPRRWCHTPSPPPNNQWWTIDGWPRPLKFQHHKRWATAWAKTLVSNERHNIPQPPKYWR